MNKTLFLILLSIPSKYSFQRHRVIYTDEIERRICRAEVVTDDCLNEISDQLMDKREILQKQLKVIAAQNGVLDAAMYLLHLKNYNNNTKIYKIVNKTIDAINNMRFAYNDSLSVKSQEISLVLQMINKARKKLRYIGVMHYTKDNGRKSSILENIKFS
uniref:Uncharacterized protein n=1 Tax=Clastoptera arizonana TaxID=38151 RepID=A0A1B6CKW8_9HEMI